MNSPVGLRRDSAVAEWRRVSRASRQGAGDGVGLGGLVGVGLVGWVLVGGRLSGGALSGKALVGKSKLVRPACSVACEMSDSAVNGMSFTLGLCDACRRAC